ncbi:YjgN family protein [Undibacterium sp. Di26W]|uniref:YjgN family protein n=1 Tax=Undibacterium sp. Di26W TaxID=3413035 RepID=UPI003BF28384
MQTSTDTDNTAPWQVPLGTDASVADASFAVGDLSLIKDLVHAQAPARAMHPITFTGNGREYFRIWIVNLCLSLATLGIYSAWAKVRRLQYFDRNTQLDGAVFNFHGNPKTILRGRVLAVLLLFCYHYLFTLSKTVALVLFIIFLLGIPFMMRSAMQFRLRNTSFRGLRFDFNGKLTESYQIYLPVALVFLLPGLIGVLYPQQKLYVGLAFLVYLAWPWLHARMRIYQHGNLSYGKLESRCSLTGSAFGWSYFAAALSLIGFVTLVVIVSMISMYSVKLFNPDAYKHYANDYGWLMALGVMAMVVVVYLIFLICGCFLQVKIWNKSWNATTFPGVQIHSTIPYFAYLRLQSKNLVLTLLSLGLYRPFAVINVYQFRLAHINLVADQFDQVLASNVPQHGQAVGDGSADLFGFDLSW